MAFFIRKFKKKIENKHKICIVWQLLSSVSFNFDAKN